MQEGRTGMKVADLCRQHRISHPTYYLWKNKYSNITVSEAKRLVEEWREEYNERRPHSSLEGKTPNEVAREEETLTGTFN